MSLLDLFSKPKRFVSEAAARSMLASQMRMTPQTLEQLRSHGVTSEHSRKLEYFFYTNTQDKAAGLAESLRALGYEVQCGPSASSKKQQVVTGWTDPMLMTELVVCEWTKRMCEVGLAHDCEFDGWGTTA